MTNSTQMRRSAANTVLRPPAGPPRSDAVARMRRLMDDCGTNKNDRVIAAITACMGYGVNTRSELIHILTRAGATPGHVAIMLAKNAGPNPSLRRWFETADGHYALHPDPLGQQRA